MMKITKGFTLIEILVVIAVLSVVGTIILTIFSRSLQGNNKSQVITSLKENGQSVLETIDKTLRSADNVVCISPAGRPPTIVTLKGGIYTRYRFSAPTTSSNGQIMQDNPIEPTPPPLGTSTTYQQVIDNVCTDPLVGGTSLTDTNTSNGVSIENLSFTKVRQAGSKDLITIKFDLLPGKLSPTATSGSVDPVTFETTIQLR